MDFILRSPERKDAAAIFEMMQPYRPYVGTSPVYTYLLICEHHAATSVVAQDARGQIVGFISAYRVPKRPDTLFIWEIAVREGYHGHQLCLRMMQTLCQRVNPAYIEATVNPSNASSIRRFQQLADLYGCSYASQTLFPAGDFGTQAHEDEVLYRIGPIMARQHLHRVSG